MRLIIPSTAEVSGEPLPEIVDLTSVAAPEGVNTAMPALAIDNVGVPAVEQSVVTPPTVVFASVEDIVSAQSMKELTTAPTVGDSSSVSLAKPAGKKTGAGEESAAVFPAATAAANVLASGVEDTVMAANEESKPLSTEGGGAGDNEVATAESRSGEKKAGITEKTYGVEGVSDFPMIVVAEVESAPAIAKTVEMSMEEVHAAALAIDRAAVEPDVALVVKEVAVVEEGEEVIVVVSTGPEEAIVPEFIAKKLYLGDGEAAPAVVEELLVGDQPAPTTVEEEVEAVKKGPVAGETSDYLASLDCELLAADVEEASSVVVAEIEKLQTGIVEAEVKALFTEIFEAEESEPAAEPKDTVEGVVDQPAVDLVVKVRCRLANDVTRLRYRLSILEYSKNRKA